jgi:beta-lactamase regulating signal transducer with metallopeptidase domain
MESFLHCIVSNAALAGALALVAVGVQRFWRSPQLAHALWFLVLVKLVTPPVFHVALLEGFALSASRRLAHRSSGDAKNLRPSALSEQSLTQTTSPPKLPPGDGEPIHAAGDSPADSAEMTVMSMSRALPGEFAVSILASRLAAGWRGWLCTVWAGGVVLGVAILWRRLGRFRALLAEAVDADAALVEDVRALARRMGLRSCPAIRILDAHVSPFVCARWRSLMMVLPARLLSELDREQQHAVLVHELAHIRRRDHLMRWFEILVRGVFWWNPLAWWASRRLRQAEEECCDAWVVWALPDVRRSYGKALLWTVEFLAERRVVPVVAGTAFGGSHIKRRIETIMHQKPNRRMSWGALIAVFALGASVLPLAAQQRADDAKTALQESVNEPVPTPSVGAAAEPSQPAPEKRNLEARIEQLERLVLELSQTVKRSTAGSNDSVQINRGAPLVSGKIDAARFMFDARTARAPESDEDRQLRETLVALNKQSWDAAGKRDWTVYEKLLADDYCGLYVNSSGSGRPDKASTIAAVKRRRYFDVNIRDVEARRIGKEIAILTYIYGCKVEEAGQLQIYRDHQATSVWTQKDGRWVLSFSQDFVLPGGE